MTIGQLGDRKQSGLNFETREQEGSAIGRGGWPGLDTRGGVAWRAALRQDVQIENATLGWLSTCICNGINMLYKYILYSEKTRIILADGVPQVNQKLIFPV